MSEPVDFDDYSANYNRLLREDTEFFSNDDAYFAKYKVGIVAENAKRPVQRLLEYGCGIGRNMEFLKQVFPGSRIVGSDISRVSLDYARNDHPTVEFHVEGERTETFGEFDLIFVAGVFHHIPLHLRAGVAGSLFDRLDPDGDLFVFEHNPFNPVTRRIVNGCPYDRDAVLLKPSELIGLLIRAGFVKVKCSYCLFFPPRLRVPKMVEESLGWLPLGGQYWVQMKRPN